MVRFCRAILIGAAILAPIALAAGCKDESKPNPEMQVPDVPPSGSGAGKGGPIGGGTAEKPK